jgi:pyruvate ferredoxin oxidoreductase delta subunit
MSLFDLLKYDEVPIGGVVKDPGNSREYRTGLWSDNVCIWNAETCTNCLQCWLVCPDESIVMDDDGKMAGVNYDFCKACGLCVEECPTDPKSLRIGKKSEVKQD